MKTLKKMLLVPGFLALGAVCMPAYSQYTQTASTDAVVYFSREKSDISRDISNIQMQRSKIEALEQKRKNAVAAKNVAEEIAAKKEIRKEMADLKRYKSYLRADKMALMEGYDQAIRDQKREIRKDYCEIRSERKALDKNLKAGNDKAASKNAVNITQYQKELDSDVAMIKEQKKARNNDVIAINERIKKSNGQFAGLINAESAVATAKNRMNK